MTTKNNKQRLKEYYLDNPTARKRVRQLERETEIPLPSITRYTKELTKEGILKKEEIANTTIYTTNRNTQAYKLAKRIHNITRINTSGLIEQLKEHYDNPAIILFGSYDKGEDTEESDIDIYIQSTTKKETKLERYEKELKRNIQLFIHEDIDEIKNKQLKNNIINGTRMNGSIEVYR